MRIIFALLLLLPTAAFAQNYTTTLVADFTGDGLIDRAELNENLEGGEADLNIWIRKSDGTLDLRTNALSVVWVGGIGQQPELAVTSRGSLQVISMNESIGRDRWHQTLTVAWRGNKFVLAGFTYEWYDTLNVADNGKCDVNLLSGKGTLSIGEEFEKKYAFKTKSRSIPIDTWDREPPVECFPVE